MTLVPTMKVYLKGTKDTAVINVTDFDPERYEKMAPARKKLPAAELEDDDSDDGEAEGSPDLEDDAQPKPKGRRKGRNRK